MGGDGAGDQGGTTGPDADNGWNDNNTGTLWGWLDSVVGGLKTVWEALTNLPKLIAEALSSAFNAVKEAVLSLPQLIIDGLKTIFIPDTDAIETSFNNFVDNLKNKFSIDTSVFETLFTTEKPVEDTYVDINIPGVGDFNLKVFDASFLQDGVNYFRPIIRGFLVLMLLLYNIKQLIGFFGYDSGVVSGRGDHIASERKAQREVE